MNYQFINFGQTTHNINQIKDIWWGARDGNEPCVEVRLFDGTEQFLLYSMTDDAREIVKLLKYVGFTVDNKIPEEHVLLIRELLKRY